MLKIIGKLFSSWNDNGVVYCHWKGNGHLEDSMTGKSDFDILVNDECMEKGSELLKMAGYKRFITQRGARYPGIQDWIGVDEETGTMIHIHLHQKMIAGHSGVMEYILPWNKLAFSTRVYDEEMGLYLINPNLEIILLYTRFGIEHSPKKMKKTKEGWALKDKTKQEVEYLKARIDTSICSNWAKELFPEFYVDLIHYIQIKEMKESDLTRLVKIMEKACSHWRRFGEMKTSLLLLLNRTGAKLRARGLSKSSITKKVPESGIGVSIAFIGQDGSGKSTVTEDIKKWLTWKIEANRFYLGSGDHYNSFLKRLISKGVQVKHQNDGQKTNDRVSGKKRKKNIKTFFTSALVSWNMLMIARRAYLVMRKAEKYRRKGGIPLLDRFPQMQFEGISDGPRIANAIKRNGLDFAINKLMAKVEYHYFNKIQQWQPSLVFKLMLPPKESIRRKPFENLENVIEKHKITKELEFANSVVIEVDATQEYQNELLQIKNKIWETLCQNQE